MGKIKVNRVSQTTYKLLPDRFCSHCGTKGVYENGADEHETLYCFACEDERPYTIFDPDHTLPRLKAREPEVVDCKAWVEEVDEFRHKFDEAVKGLWLKHLEADLYSPRLSFDKAYGETKTIPLVYQPMPIKGTEE